MSDAGRPEAVIFDFGYVLFLPIDKEAWQANLQALAIEHGFEKAGHLWEHIYESDAWERAKRGQMTRDAFWADRVGALGVKDEAGVTRIRQRLFEHVPAIHPAMRQLVHDLRPSVRLAILSNTAVRNMDRWLAEEHDMAGVFEVVVGSADVRLAKPEPEIYQMVLERLGLPPHKTLFIDDMQRNIEAAQALGIPSIEFTSPEELRAELELRGLLEPSAESE
jgi:epoxide hydrolase-like predicted phosphatase